MKSELNTPNISKGGRAEAKYSKTLSIVIPVYNEKEAVGETIDQISDILKKANIRYQLVLVNDGSTDGSGEVIKNRLTKLKNANVLLCEHPVNRGYGAALKTGIAAAVYNNICITDADGTYPNERIPDMLSIALKDGCDMIVGKRPFKKLPAATKPAKWFLTKLAGYLVNEKIGDINSGLRIFKKDVISQFFSIISDEFSFTTTSTIALMSNGYRICYMDIDYMKRKGKSKIHPIRDTLNFLKIIIRTVLYFNPLKVFVPASLALLFIGLAIFLIGLVFGKHYSMTFLIFFVTAIQLLGIGMLADLIDKRIHNMYASNKAVYENQKRRIM